MENQEIVFPVDMVRDNPGIRRWSIWGFTFPEAVPLQSLEQRCRGQLILRPWENDENAELQFNGEKATLVSKEDEVCRIGIGEPDSHGDYPESQIKIVDGRPEAAP